MEDKSWADISKVIVGLVLLAGLVLFKAFVLIRMWVWFVMPTFTTAPMLNYPTAIGIASMVGLLVHHQPKESELSIYALLYNGYVYCLVGLFFAWITQMFM